MLHRHRRYEPQFAVYYALYIRSTTHRILSSLLPSSKSIFRRPSSSLLNSILQLHASEICLALGDRHPADPVVAVRWGEDELFRVLVGTIFYGKPPAL